MLIIQDVLISDDIIEEQFVCQLTACQGACCWEGELGAPLEEEELPVLEKIYETVAPFLSPAGRKAIEEQGVYIEYEEDKSYATPLIDNGPCAYMIIQANGVAKCGIEAAYQAGAIDFRKPISCHLYPIRVESNKAAGFEALNYDRWDICSAACGNGRKQGVAIYQFVRDALIRKYGREFYEELDAAAEHLKK